MEAQPKGYGFSVSHTTRDPRPGEEHGKHYFFAEKEAMQKEIDQGLFLEHAHVHGNIYGTSIKAVNDVLDQGKCCILDIDVQGARSVRKSGIKAMFLFVSPPSFEELEARLRGRGTETEEKIMTRLGNAKGEMDAMEEAGLFDYIMVNDDIEKAPEVLAQIAKKALSGGGPEKVGSAVRWAQ